MHVGKKKRLRSDRTNSACPANATHVRFHVLDRAAIVVIFHGEFELHRNPGLQRFGRPLPNDAAAVQEDVDEVEESAAGNASTAPDHSESSPARDFPQSCGKLDATDKSPWIAHVDRRHRRKPGIAACRHVGQVHRKCLPPSAGLG